MSETDNKAAETPEQKLTIEDILAMMGGGKRRDAEKSADEALKEMTEALTNAVAAGKLAALAIVAVDKDGESVVSTLVAPKDAPEVIACLEMQKATIVDHLVRSRTRTR